MLMSVTMPECGGAGFTASLSIRYPQAREDYLRNPKVLGDVRVVKVGENLLVCNMIAQVGVRSKRNPTPLSMAFLEQCLRGLNGYAHMYHLSVHMPKIGSGLGGGDWTRIEWLIKKCLYAVDVFIYELPK